MAKKSEAQVKFTADTKDLNRELAGINDSLKTNRAALKLNAAELQNAGDDTDTLAEKEKLLSDAIETSGQKIELLSQKLDQAEELLGKNSKEYVSLERSVLAAKTEQQKFIKELSDTREALNASDGALEAVEDAVDDLSDEMETGAKEADTFADVLKADLASEAIISGIEKLSDGVKSVVSECVSLASDGVKGINDFSAATGITGVKLQEMEEVMKGIYNNNFGESMTDVSQSLQVVSRATDLTGDKLQKATENAILLSDVFGYEVAESTRSASTLMNQFGIDYDTAMNLIAQGAQNGLDYSDELLDTINEYSVQFKQFGFDAEEMFNIMSRGVENGAFNLDKVGDAVKEFGIRITDGSDTTKEGMEAIGLSADEMAKKYQKGGKDAREAFDQVITGLENMKDPVERNQAGVNLFGTMWEDLGPKVVLSLNDQTEAIDTNKDALEQMNDVKYDDIESAMEGIKRNLTSSIADPIEERILPKLQEVGENTDFDSLADSIGTATDKLIEGVSWLGQHQGLLMGVGTAIGIVTAGITAYNIVQGIKLAMEAAEVTTLGGLVAVQLASAAATAAAVAPFILVAAAIAGVVAIGVLLYKNWDIVKAKAGELKDQVVTKVTGLKESAVAKFNELKTNAVNKVTELKTNAVNKANELKTGFVNKFTEIKTGAVNKVEEIKNGIVTKIESLKNKVKGIVDKIKGFFTGGWSLPHIKLPHFSVSPPGWKIGDLLKGTIPSLGISWYAKGGYFNGPTVLSGLGESGPEYALPLNRTTLQPLAEGIVKELSSLPGKAVNIINNFNGTVVREEADIKKIANAVNEKLAGEVI